MSKEYQSTFLIIGGGIAGVSCAEVLSFICPNETIILLTASDLIKKVSNLIPLGKALTKFTVEEHQYSTLSSDKLLVYVDNLIYIDSTNQRVLTRLNKCIRYKYLCLCTGGIPKLFEDNNKFIIGIRDTESVIEFQTRLKASKKILLLGNGGIASELAYEAKNIEIDWVIKDNHISSNFVDPGIAHFFEQLLRNKNVDTNQKSTIKRMRYSEYNLLKENQSENKIYSGAALGPDWHSKIDVTGNIQNSENSVRIHFNTEIEQIEQLKNSEFALLVKLKNGETINCDFIVSATGVIPTSNLACDQELKLESDGGISVDEMMRTNINHIYAAGDCCHANWLKSENWFQMRLWTQARQMGAMAGKSMAAHFNNEEIYQDFCFELFGHVTKLFGMQVVLLGNYNGQGLGANYEILLRMTPGEEYVKFVLKDGKLRGAILIGETGLEETCENLILNKIDLTPYGDDILDPNIDIEDYFD